MNISDTRPPDMEGRDTALVHCLQRIWVYPITTKSDAARQFADEVAEGASRELLTTAVVPSKAGKIFGRIWKLTPKGLQFLWDNADQLTFEEHAYVASYCTVGVEA
jgi:hypothetical protein